MANEAQGGGEMSFFSAPWQDELALRSPKFQRMGNHSRMATGREARRRMERAIKRQAKTPRRSAK